MKTLIVPAPPDALAAKRVAFKSLVWDGDSVVDLIGGFPGGSRVQIDGTVGRVGRHLPYRFDGCRHLRLDDGRTWTVVFEANGTKALLLHNDELVREIDRSYYCAHTAHFPIALGLRHGRPLLAHVSEYDELHLYDLVQDQLLTRREPPFRGSWWWADLDFSPDGRYLLDRGWVWHPIYTAAVYDVDEAIVDPGTLNGPGLMPTLWAGENDTAASAFISSDRVAVIASPGTDNRTEENREDPTSIAPGDLGVWHVASGRWLSQITPPSTGRIVGFDETLLFPDGPHPMLINPFDGRVIHEWPELPFDESQRRLVAVDPANDRLAIFANDTLLISTEVFGASA